jgi:hypothetical protein
VSGYESNYFFRSTLTTIGSTTTYQTCSQRIEGVLASGATATVSFYAKSDSNRTQSVKLGQNYGSGGSGDTDVVANGSFNTTTSWQRFSFTGTVASATGKTIGTNPFAYFYIQQAAASGSILDIWGVQVEYSSVATAFQTATGTIQGELDACQRYYARLNYTNTSVVCGGAAGSTTTVYGTPIPFPVQMRVTPSAAVSANTHFTAIKFSPAGLFISSAVTLNVSANAVAFYPMTVATGVVADESVIVLSNTVGSFIEMSAEL